MSVTTVRPIELRKDASPLPIYRFTTDITVRMWNRDPTVPGMVATDALLLEDVVGGDDYLLLEDSITDAGYIKLEG